MAPGAHQRFGDFQRLLAVVGLRNQQIIHIHAEPLGIGRVERVFGIHKGCHAASLLGFGDNLQADGGFARGFRAEDFNHAAARNSAHAQSGVKGDAAGGDHRDGNDGPLASQPHDGTLAKLLFNLRERKINCAGPVFGHEALLACRLSGAQAAISLEAGNLPLQCRRNRNTVRLTHDLQVG